MTLETRTPCCGRKMVLPQFRYASANYKRKCRGCGRRWSITITPTQVGRGGIRQFDTLTWVPCPPGKEETGDLR